MIAFGITLRSRVAIVIARGNRFLRFGLFFLAGGGGDRSRSTAWLAVLQTLVRCPVATFRTLDGFPGSPAFSSVCHLRLLRLSAIILDQLMNLLLVGVMIAVAEGTHIVSPL